MICFHISWNISVLTDGVPNDGEQSDVKMITLPLPTLLTISAGPSSLSRLVISHLAITSAFSASK
jgi:hypothetical protein